MASKSPAVARSRTPGAAPSPPDPSAQQQARLQFHSLEDWLASDETLREGLRGVELGTETRGRELLRLLLQAHIHQRGLGDVGPAVELVDADGRKHLLPRQQRLRVRSILTLFGEVTVERYRYAQRRGPCVHPLDEALQLPERSYSYELQRRLVKRAVQGPFQEAIDGLHEATGVRVPKRSAERVLIDASRDVDAFYAQRKGPGPKSTGPILVGSIDGKGIPMVRSEPAPKVVRRSKGERANKKRMATVAAVYTQQPRVRTPEGVVESLFHEAEPRPREARAGPEHKRVWASLRLNKDDFMQDVKAEMDRRDPRRVKTRVVVTDGERALQRRVSEKMEGAVVVLDFLHVLEKLWAVAYVFHPEGSPQAVAFVRERALRILRGQVSQVVKGFRQMATKRRLRGEKKRVVLNVAGYYYRNRSRMRYDEYLAKGLPIASGCVEGACKNLIKDRMERSGMRWSEEGAEAMVRVRAVYLSGDFDEHWDYHVGMEQQRLYPPKRWRRTRVLK